MPAFEVPSGPVRLARSIASAAWHTPVVSSGWTGAGMCQRSNEVLTVIPLSAAPRGLDLHHDPEYTKQITNVRWIVLHVIEETAAHSGHLEIACELLDGKTRLGGR